MSKPEPKNEIVPVAKKAGTLVAITGMDTVLCNVPCKTPAERVVIFNAIAGQCGKLDDLINKKLYVKNAIIARHDWISEDTGEVTPGHKIWLILKDDKVYFSGSSGLAKSLLLMQGFFGDPPWEPAVECELKQLAVADGMRYLTLNLVG